MSALPPKAALNPPEVLKSRRRQFGAAHPVLNVAVTEIYLQGPRIVSCERVSTRVSKIPLKLVGRGMISVCSVSRYVRYRGKADMPF